MAWWNYDENHANCMCGSEIPFQIYTKVLGLDRYHAGARYPILSATAIPITDTGLYKFFVLKMRYGAGYRCV